MDRKFFINVAVSLDNNIGFHGKQIQISSEDDWKIVHNMRNIVSAIIVGSETVLTDNPSLRTKIKYIDGDVISHPIPIILDRRGRCLDDANIFMQSKGNPVIWVTNSTREIEGVTKIKPVDISELVIAIDEQLSKFGRKGNVMIEGGANIITQFLNSGSICKLRIYRAPFTLYGGIPLFTEDVKVKLELSEVNWLEEGHEEIYYLSD